MALTLKQLRYFLAAAETGQISLAAMELNISQSAITTAIQGLEAQLGVRLLDRSPQGVVPTIEGARFLNHARNITAAVEDAERLPLGEGRRLTGRLRLGTTYTVAGYYMSRHYARFRRAYPDIAVEMVEWPRMAVEEGLATGSLDMAVMLVSNLTNRAGLEQETLMRSRRRLWLATDHPLLSADRITLADVAAQPYVILTVDEAKDTAGRYWARAGLEPQVTFATSSVEAVRSMVASGMGVTILSDMVYRPWSLEGQRIELRSVVEEVPSMDVGLAWCKTRPLAPAAAVFRAFMSVAMGGGG
ncbi:MAG: transcriptional regulator [Rhodobacteraceae bacterium]|uniref:LysR family transcriptional regulator n=1 Tax=Cypionkella sp. TaxID=2811411 RepID=UPI0013227DAE|nr:LysR family transcriptional regulator [Cypionkella sp.]KAF0170998.1 MAG: transcriptional regulator [Paracoccaceae bacterium]MDO8327239.1 LysR family transcriptional regulator [Cypionkella sp.]